MSDKDLGNLRAIVNNCHKIERFTSDLNNADEFYED